MVITAPAACPETLKHTGYGMKVRIRKPLKIGTGLYDVEDRG